MYFDPNPTSTVEAENSFIMSRFARQITTLLEVEKDFSLDPKDFVWKPSRGSDSLIKEVKESCDGFLYDIETNNTDDVVLRLPNGLTEVFQDSSHLNMEGCSTTQYRSPSILDGLDEASSKKSGLPSLDILEDSNFEPIQLPDTSDRHLSKLKVSSLQSSLISELKYGAAKLSTKSSSTGKNSVKGSISSLQSGITTSSFCTSNEELKNLINLRKNNLRRTHIVLK